MCLNNNIILSENTMLKARPELIDEWDFEKNDELGLNVYEVTKGTKKKAWWICPKCKSPYDASVNNRTSGKNCPYCSGRKTNHTNSLASLNPQLASEWHSTKNNELTPHEVTCYKNTKVWWKGSCGHEWEAYISKRNNGQNCPYCSAKKFEVGINDMWTTNPELASMLLYKADGYKYTQTSGEKADWKCICGEVIKQVKISNVKNRGLPCPSCSDGISYPQKFVFNLLKSLDLHFYKEYVFEWSDSKRYDFYIPSLNCIIETHGMQHYDGNFKRVGGKNLKQEQENDEIKRRLAFKNGIVLYVELDCRQSTMKHIKNSIMNSELVDIIDLEYVDWDYISTISERNLVHRVWGLYNEGFSKYEIQETVGLHESTINKYVRNGIDVGVLV